MNEALKLAEDALQAARQFIRNGIDLGFIRMPDDDTPDSAHETLPLVDRALAALAQQEAQGEPVAWTSSTSAGAVNFGKDWVFSPIKTSRADVPLYIRPAPATGADVPEDVQRDADRYRCLRAIKTWPSTDFEFQAGLCVDLWGEDGYGQQVAGEDLDHAVDAMLAASKEPTGGNNGY